MNREIKFIQRTINGSWHHWGYVIDGEPNTFITPIQGRSFEFTGLLDKEGKEIYEGHKYKWWGWEVKAGKQIRPERFGIVEDTIPSLHKAYCIASNGMSELEIIGHIAEGESE
jgi:hypothetical protein